MTKILGMGNALVDVLAIMENDGLLEALDLPKGSMQLIDDAKFKIISEEISKLKTDIVSGGSASNTIVGLAKLGVQTGFLGRIGKDFFGKFYKDDLIKNNINNHLIEADEASGVASTFISKDGERTFGTYLGAAARLKAEDLKKEDFEGYDYFYIEGYLVQNYDLIRSAIILAKEAGAKVILDMASFNIVEDSRDFLLEIIPQYVDIIFANQQEAETLLNLDVEDTISILAQRTEIAVIKVGAKGSWVQKGDERVFIPACKVSCIDSTGAGDLYASGFIYGLINDYSLKACGEIGTLLAAEVIQEVGAKIDDEKWDALTNRIKEMA